MAKTKRPDQPPSRLPNGKVNPAYTAWRKVHILKEPAQPEAKVLTEEVLNEALGEIIKDNERVEIQAGVEEAKYESLAETLTLQCVKLARNTRFILCTAPDKSGKTVPVRILPRTHGRKFLKKPVQVQMIDGKFVMVR